jgi:hypothetical protein
LFWGRRGMVNVYFDDTVVAAAEDNDGALLVGGADGVGCRVGGGIMKGRIGRRS